MNCSVVIACHTESRWSLLLNAVDSVRSQSVRPAATMLVVDHNRTLYTRLDRALARRDWSDVTLTENMLSPGASGARNTGAFAVTSPFVAFLDDDAAAEPDWLARLLRCFADPGVVGVGGRVLPAWERTRPGWFPPEFDWVVGASHVGMPTATTRVRNVWAENMAVRRDVFERVQGFRTGFGKLGARSRPEDTDLCLRMAAAGGGGWTYVHDAVVRHHVPASRSTYGFFVRRSYAEGRGKAELARLLPANGTALSTERAYVRRTLPAGVRRHLTDGLRTNSIGGLARAGTIIAGLASAAVGFAAHELTVRCRGERSGRRGEAVAPGRADTIAVAP